jgi:hypothetical protein
MDGLIVMGGLAFVGFLVVAIPLAMLGMGGLGVISDFIDSFRR